MHNYYKNSLGSYATESICIAIHVTFCHHVERSSVLRPLDDRVMFRPKANNLKMVSRIPFLSTGLFQSRNGLCLKKGDAISKPYS